MTTATMTAAMLTSPGQIEIQCVPRPEAGANEVRIKVARCGVCGTDAHIFNGHYAADRLPLIPGHEFAGHIDQLGPGVRGLAVGQKVIADINIGCGHCFYCRRNQVLNCAHVTQLGIHTHGAFAEYVCLPARQVIPIPADMPADVAALSEPLACVVRAAKKVDLRLGDSVLVLGAGPIGNLHAQLARAIGAAPVIVAERDPERAALAGRCGADHVVCDPAALHDVVMAATHGRGADVVIESVGAPTLYDQALALLRPGGRLAAFGITDPTARVALALLKLVLDEIGIQGSVAGMGEDMHQALTLLAHGRLHTAPFRQVVRPLSALQDSLAAFSTHPEILKVQIDLSAP